MTIAGFCVVAAAILFASALQASIGFGMGMFAAPIVAMIENHRTGLVWNTMRKNPHIRRGLQRAGFTGGWLG